METNEQGGFAGFIKSRAGLASAAVAGVALVAGALIFIGGGTQEEPVASPTANATMAPIEIPLDRPLPATSTPAGSPSGQEEQDGGVSPVDGQLGPEDGSLSPAAGPSAAPVSGPIRVGDAPQAPTAGEWQPTAEAFAKAWGNPSVGKEAWLAAIKPHVTAAQYEKFTYTNLVNVPQDELKFVTLDEEFARTARFQATFVNSGPQILGFVEIQNDGSWLVSAVGEPGE